MKNFCRFLVFIGWILLTGIFLSGVCLATILTKQFSTQEITSRADCIAMGIVTDISYITDNDQVYTVTNIECNLIFKGDPNETSFQVIQLGGKTDKYTRGVYGAASYAVNEEVILFLEDNKYQKSLKRVIGLSMGKYSVIEDPSTGEKFAVSDQTELHFVQPVKDPFASRVIKKPLDEFIEEIQLAVEQHSGTSMNINSPDDSSNHEFDWIRYIQKLIIDFANDMADKYYEMTAHEAKQNETK
ncbi:MAG: hypothetical protein RBU23_11335 [Candidatus Auribacterota bacterium]|jgi:hypothetical protein|nr:hypothetical protein [Candidatus Auribacterota bacterium]